MGFNGYICKKRDIEYGTPVASYCPDRLYDIFQEIDEKLTEEQKEKFLHGGKVVRWSDEVGTDFEIDPKILYSLFDEPELISFLNFLNEKEKKWLYSMYSDIKEDKEYHIKNGYIRIDFF